MSSNVEFVVGELSSAWRVIDPNDPGPLWTEADWSPIGLRTFSVSDPAIDYLFLVVAIVETIITSGTVIVLKKRFDLWFRITRH